MSTKKGRYGHPAKRRKVSGEAVAGRKDVVIRIGDELDGSLDDAEYHAAFEQLYSDLARS